MKYNIGQHVSVTGKDCIVRVGNSATDCKVVGFVDSFSATKQFQLEEERVLGHIMPVAIDAQSFSVSAQLSGFLPTKAVYESSEKVAGMGDVSIGSFNPRSEIFAKDGTVTKFPYLDFYDERTGSIVCGIEWAIPESFAIQSNGQSYIKCNVSLRAVDMSGGADYIATDDPEKI